MDLTSPTKPYFFTWSAQQAATGMPVVTACDDEFLLSDGSRVYDFVSTSYQANFGHSCQRIKDRIHSQLDQLAIVSPKAEFELKQTVSQRLQDLLNLGPGKLFYTVSGAESVENALKMARQIRKRKKIMARRPSYHGATLGALSVTGDWRNLPHFTCDHETVRIPEPADDPQLVETRNIVDRHRGDIAAVILETITGANGVIAPPVSWYRGMQELCRSENIFMILDEVLCGFGRTGKAFAFHHYRGSDIASTAAGAFQLQPDIVCMSKAISGGYIPFGALWVSQEIAEYYNQKTLSCGLTNYAHPLGLAALDGVLDLLADPRFQSNAIELERVFASRLQQISEHRIVTAMRQRGMLAAIEFDCEAPTWEQGIREGLHLAAKGNRNILAPPLISKPDRLQQACDDYIRMLDSFKT